MKVVVYGLGHLGHVTAGCLHKLGVYAVGLYLPYPSEGEKPLFPSEPDLTDIEVTLTNQEVVIGADFLWITFDTPVDEDGNANVDWVFDRMNEILPLIGPETAVIVSSQLPVGSVRKLEIAYPLLTFYCLPENLRHGTAVENFLKPDRIVVGCRPFVGNRRRIFSGLLDKIVPLEKIQWMSTESAEMTKHAINAWMAMSICFANEIADLCKLSGADPAEVERGMRTEERIGQKAKIRAGEPYTGKTLARDVQYLRELGANDNEFPLLWSIRDSNQKRGGE